MVSSQTQTRAPALFISHGGGPFPLFADDHESYRAMLHSHTYLFDNTDEPHISGGDSPGFFYDYEHMRNTLPAKCFELQYQGSGDAALAKNIANRLRTTGFLPVIEERAWDYGVYVPMGIMFPDGIIPIVQMSKNIRLGQALEPFRDEGYAIVGSGGSSHDFGKIAAAYFDKEGKAPKPPKEIQLFEDFLMDVAETQDLEWRKKKLCGWREAPSNQLAHLLGSSEHLMPYMVVAGSGGNDAGRRLDQWSLKGTPVGLYLW
ncbi:Extradiol ring-cleavage dioxygenase, class III enzyme, subunit B [Pyrenochaeta sp. MPI-SDFR-AT-0127]|nr:Extradiol ring-cleavage dioxygenase, class III enzyme, subunit B [Pyrenochaeta sp. MPI-SDFR-AT-0127]